MLDPWVRRNIDGWLDAVGAGLATRGVVADHLSVAGFAAGLGAALAVALQAYWLGFALLVLNRLLDGLDGAVARAAGPTDRGAFLDITLDFIVYAAIPAAFALADPARNALWAAILLFAFVGTASTFLAYAIFAEKRGLATQRTGRKTIFYLGGLAEGTETALVLLAMCAFPMAFPWLAGAFALACAITAVARLRSGVVSFADPRR